MGLSERQTLMPKQLGLLGKVLRIPCARAAAKRSSAPPFASTALAAQQQHRWAPGAAALISWFRRRHFEDVHRAERLRVWCGYSARLYDSGGGSRHRNRLLTLQPRAKILAASSPAQACCNNSELSHTYEDSHYHSKGFARAISARGAGLRGRQRAVRGSAVASPSRHFARKSQASTLL